MPGPLAIYNGQIALVQPRQALASIGKYYSVTNPTPGTAIAYALQTSFSATANGFFAVRNTNPSGGANIILDYLRLKQTATAATGTLVMNFEVYNETGIVALTGNVATRTPVQPNQAYPQSTGAVVQSFAAGAATVPAAVGSRVLQTTGYINTGVTVIHDTYVLQFGGGDIVPGTAGLTAARATASATIGGQAGPVVVAPQTTSWINMWWVTAAANAPSFEFELTYAEL